MSKTKKLLLIAVLSGAGAVLSILEGMLPVITAIPGGKLGIANIVTLTALYVMGSVPAIAVSVVRTIVASVLYGGFNAFMYSFSGAVFSTLVMILLKKALGRKISIVGVSVSGAASNNVAQVFVAWCLIHSSSLWFYLSGLLALSVVFGICSGLCAGECIKRLNFKNTEDVKG